MIYYYESNYIRAKFSTQGTLHFYKDYLYRRHKVLVPSSSLSRHNETTLSVTPLYTQDKGFQEESSQLPLELWVDQHIKVPFADVINIKQVIVRWKPSPLDVSTGSEDDSSTEGDPGEKLEDPPSINTK